MFPSKSSFDYMTEMNRLFPRSQEIQDNEFQIRNYNSTYSHSMNSTIPNQSSSSADSLSPEVFPQISPLQNQTERSRGRLILETPPTRRHRPIVGRKLLGNSEHVPSFDSSLQLSPVQSIDSDAEFKMSWQGSPHCSSTPPNHQLEPKHYSQNVFYELFPTETRDSEFRTPIKRPSRIPVNYSANISPNSALSVSPVSSRFSNAYPTPPPPFRRNITTSFVAGSSSIHPEINSGKLCTFCRKNGETPIVYMTHTVKEMIGNRNLVTCPILRSHVCATCGASGDNAHTITYCPVLRSSNNGRPLQSTTITLKNTRVKSNGRKRY